MTDHGARGLLGSASVNSFVHGGGPSPGACSLADRTLASSGTCYWPSVDCISAGGGHRRAPARSQTERSLPQGPATGHRWIASPPGAGIAGRLLARKLNARFLRHPTLPGPDPGAASAGLRRTLWLPTKGVFRPPLFGGRGRWSPAGTVLRPVASRTRNRAPLTGPSRFSTAGGGHRRAPARSQTERSLPQAPDTGRSQTRGVPRCPCRQGLVYTRQVSSDPLWLGGGALVPHLPVTRRHEVLCLGIAKRPAEFEGR